MTLTTVRAVASRRGFVSMGAVQGVAGLLVFAGYVDEEGVSVPWAIWGLCWRGWVPRIRARRRLGNMPASASISSR